MAEGALQPVVGMRLSLEQAALSHVEVSDDTTPLRASRLPEGARSLSILWVFTA